MHPEDDLTRGRTHDLLIMTAFYHWKSVLITQPSVPRMVRFRAFHILSKFLTFKTYKVVTIFMFLPTAILVTFTFLVPWFKPYFLSILCDAPPYWKASVLCFSNFKHQFFNIKLFAHQRWFVFPTKCTQLSAAHSLNGICNNICKHSDNCKQQIRLNFLDFILSTKLLMIQKIKILSCNLAWKKGLYFLAISEKPKVKESL